MDSNEGDGVKWGSSAEFVLSLVGYAVGLTTILRFPYICMNNGGGAFLVPYFLCLLLCGVPLMFLEMVIGQSQQTGCICCWDRCIPLVKGVGVGMVIISFLVSVYYQIHYAWILFYIASSFTWDLPWTSCNATWNTQNCLSTFDNTTLLQNHSELVPATEEFFNRQVLKISDGIESLDGLNWQLLICHIIGWIMIYCCIVKGIKSVGKVVYVTATVPYLLLIIFLIRISFLPGSLDGFIYFISPDFSKLPRPEIWIQAFIQVFYSLGPGWGGLITMSSFNRYNHPLYREAIIVPIICGFTSVLCGLLVFGVSGFLAHRKGVTVDQAASSGPGLAFSTYPEVAAHLPGAPVWSILFFLMLICVGADSQFVLLETAISASIQTFNIHKKHHVIFTTASVLLSMILGLPFVTRGGMYLFTVLDWYLSAIAVFLFVAVESLAMVWIYGYDRLFHDIESMIGYKPCKKLLTAVWGVIIPAVLIMGLIWSLLNLSLPVYGHYVFPKWVGSLGLSISVCAALPIPVVALYKFFTAKGTTWKQKLRSTLFVDGRIENSQLTVLDLAECC